MRRGQVTAGNPKRSRWAILTTSGHGYTIVDVIRGDVEFRDVIEWDDDMAYGRQNYRNVTKGTVVDLEVLNHGVTNATLHQQLNPQW